MVTGGMGSSSNTQLKKGAVRSKVQIAALSFKVNLYGICSCALSACPQIL